jgi:hypothetical protein
VIEDVYKEGGRAAVALLEVAPKGKDIANNTLPYPGTGELRL